MRTARRYSQPAAIVAALLVAPLPFACGGSTDAVLPTEDAGGDEFTFPHNEAGLQDLFRPDVGLKDTGPEGPAAHPPAPPSAPMTAVATEHNFAVHTLFLGDTPRDSGTQSTTAWKKFGYDLDGKVSTRNSTDVCTVTAGAPKSVLDDGDLGIDNSFGANLLPIFESTFGASFGSAINTSISTGKTTLLIDTVGLSDDTSQTNIGLAGQLFEGGLFAGSPTFTVTDNWPVKPGSLTDGSSILGGAKTKFPAAYVVGGTWVGPASGAVTVRLAASSGPPLTLVIHNAVVSFNHSAATKATNGTIAGVLDTEEFIAMFQSVAGSISVSLCSGSAFDSIANQIRQANDILKDGTNVAGSPCTGISIGLGFEADQIAPPTTVSPASPPPPDPCAG